jgi:capsular polysaccharide biosynthesis protein
MLSGRLHDSFRVTRKKNKPFRVKKFAVSHIRVTNSGATAGQTWFCRRSASLFASDSIRAAVEPKSFWEFVVDGRELIRRLALRWPLLLIGAVLALVVGGVVFAASPASYTAQAGVLVLPPPTEPGDTTPVNPLASLDSGAIQVASTLVYTAGSPAVVDTVANASNGGTSTVLNTTDDPGNDTPFIQITATGSSESNARSAATATITALTTQLRTIQNGVAPSLLMHLSVIVAPTTAAASTSSLIKAGGLAAILVFILALLAIALLDRFLPAFELRSLLRHKPKANAPAPLMASGD